MPVTNKNRLVIVRGYYPSHMTFLHRYGIVILNVVQ